MDLLMFWKWEWIRFWEWDWMSIFMILTIACTVLLGVALIASQGAFRDGCRKTCRPSDSMVIGGGFEAEKCYCQRDGEWKIEKVR